MPKRREDKELSKYSKYKARVDLTKIRQVASVLALLARSLGLCWGDCTCSHPLASACVGFVCVFGRCKSRVVMVVTRALSIRCLLAEKRSQKPLFKYINETNRLAATFGDVLIHNRLGADDS